MKISCLQDSSSVIGVLSPAKNPPESGTGEVFAMLVDSQGADVSMQTDVDGVLDDADEDTGEEEHPGDLIAATATPETFVVPERLGSDLAGTAVSEDPSRLAQAPVSATDNETASIEQVFATTDASVSQDDLGTGEVKKIGATHHAALAEFRAGQQQAQGSDTTETTGLTDPTVSAGSATGKDREVQLLVPRGKASGDRTVSKEAQQPVLAFDVPSALTFEERASPAPFSISVHQTKQAMDGHDIPAPVLSRPPVHDPQHVLRQIGEKLGGIQDGTVEIALSPEELGKIRLVISSGDRPAVTVFADRPETFDLLRRNAEYLDRELRGSGIYGADISFSDGRENRNANRGFSTGGPPVSDGEDGKPSILDRQATSRPKSQMDRRIDIRI